MHHLHVHSLAREEARSRLVTAATATPTRIIIEAAASAFAELASHVVVRVGRAYSGRAVDSVNDGSTSGRIVYDGGRKSSSSSRLSHSHSSHAAACAKKVGRENLHAVGGREGVEDVDCAFERRKRAQPTNRKVRKL